MNKVNYTEYLEKSLPESFFISSYDSDTITAFVPHNEIYSVAKFLHKNSNLQYKILTDVTVVDWLGRHTDKIAANKLESLCSSLKIARILNTEARFCLVYNFLSPRYNHRVILKSFIDPDTLVDSLCSLYRSANWWERETWDMFGVMFKNHPDLRRILTDYGFEGFPLRKDFPLSGYTEIRYDENEKKIVTDPVEFSQEYRNFDYTTPWIS